MKKLITLTLALVIALSTVGCAGGNPHPVNSSQWYQHEQYKSDQRAHRAQRRHYRNYRSTNY